MTITLYQYKPHMGLPNASPFCMKLEMYLRMGGFEHKVVALKGRPASPTRKAPYIRLDGKLMADSGIIIDHLERGFGHRVDGKLTLAQRAESLALQRMMEEHLYWVMVYARWVDVDAWAETDAYIRMILGLPGPVAVVAVPMLRRAMRRTLHAQGIGRHDPDTIWQLGIADVAALGHWLGTRTYGFGDEPTVFDACLASFIGGIVRQPWSNPLRVATAKYGNLVAHFERMTARYFPEFTG
ncbi:MAG: glutathione S-transferase family protein [Rhodospirillaceae bacterium]|nr:MAG: glutathione S-transferase family protein [Rhodospirillaceae bacterium]